MKDSNEMCTDIGMNMAFVLAEVEGNHLQNTRMTTTMQLASCAVICLQARMRRNVYCLTSYEWFFLRQCIAPKKTPANLCSLQKKLVELVRFRHGWKMNLKLRNFFRPHVTQLSVSLVSKRSVSFAQALRKLCASFAGNIHIVLYFKNNMPILFSRKIHDQKHNDAKDQSMNAKSDVGR